MPVTQSLLASMPKVELHLHLEGAIPIDAMWAMVERHGGTDEVPTRAALLERFTFTDFPHFIDTWIWKLQFHRTYEDYELIGESVARSLAEQRIVYAEAYVSPSDAFHAGLETQELLLAVRRGLDRVEGTEVALVPDLVRDTGPERAMRTLAEAAEVRTEAGVVGITIGGSEQSFPPARFAPVFARAQDLGLRLTAHAGEASGPESVWSAIRDLGVDRIGHGVRAVEDPALVEYLVETQIPLEVCPTSNLRTGVAVDWASHPVRRLIESGARVTINTDDPAMFHCDLVGEYLALVEQYGYGLDELVGLARNAIDASWAPAARKAELAAAHDAWSEREN